MNDLSGKVGLDTTDFKAAIGQMNRDIRVIESGFRASAAALGDWSKDASGLELRIKALNEQIGIQSQKVEALRGEYERVAAEKGATSRAAEELEIRLNKETETLNKMKGELSQTEESLAEMGDESAEAGDKVEDLGDKSQDAGGKLEGLKRVAAGLGEALKVGVAAVAGLAAAVAGVGAAITGLVLNTSQAAGELQDLSAKTGISTTRLQELDYVGKQVGTSTETMTGAMSRLVRSMGDARDQQQKFDQQLAAGKMEDEIKVPIEMAAAFNRLGVSFVGTKGELRDAEAVFGEAINALGKIPNETERDALAMQIFGKSAQELNPLIKAGAGEIARLSQEAHDMGAVISEEGVNALAEFDDKMESLKAGLKGIGGTIATAFLPAFSGIAEHLKGYMKQAAKIVQESGGDFGKMASEFGKLFEQIARDIAAKAPEAMKAGLAIIQSIIKAIVDALPTIIPAAIAIIQSLVEFLVQNLPLLMRSGVDILLALVNAILPQLPMLIDVALKMVTELMNGLSTALPKLVPVIVQVTILIVETLIKNLPLLIEAATKLIQGLAEGLIAALPILLPAIPKIVKAIFDAIIAALPILGEAAKKLILTLVTGIAANLPLLAVSAVELVGVILDGIRREIVQFTEVGGDLVRGVWDGIAAKADWFRHQVEDFFRTIVDGVKDMLGIQSLPKVFEGIGANMAAGLGTGFSDSFRRFEQQMNTAIGGLGTDMSITANMGSIKSNSGSAGITFGDIIIQITGNADYNTVRRGVQDGLSAGLRARGLA
jgi:methyl-accepting chemotaxis protein